MMQTIGCGMTVWGCHSIGRSSAIGGCWVAILHLVVFNCRGSIAILAMGSHVVGYMHAPIDVGVILVYFPRLIGAGTCRGIVDCDPLLFHVGEAAKAGRIGRVGVGAGAELLLMLWEP